MPSLIPNFHQSPSGGYYDNPSGGFMGVTNKGQYHTTDPNKDTSSMSPYDKAIEMERQRRAAAGLYTGEGWASPEWLAQLKNDVTTSTIDKREADLSNPNSKYYTDYYKQLKGTLSAQSSLNSLLGLNRAMGLSMTGSATIANEQRNALQGKITDYATQGMQTLFQNNTSGANSLLGMQLSGSQFQQQLAFNKKQYEDSQKFNWGSLLGIVGKVGGYFLGGSGGSANTQIGNNEWYRSQPNVTYN